MIRCEQDEWLSGMPGITALLCRWFLLLFVVCFKNFPNKSYKASKNFKTPAWVNVG